MKKYYYNKSDEAFIFPNNVFTKEQIEEIRKPTPPSEIETTTDENGNTFKSVKSSYVKYKLNVLFGFDWRLNIISKDHFPASKEVLVHGILIINSKKKAKREQFGSSFVEYKTTQIENIKRTAPINLGFAYKAAASDCLKKCCSEFGLFWDVYSGEIINTKKEESKPEYQEQKKLERADKFMSKCDNPEDIEFEYSKLFPDGKETKNSNELLNKHLEKFGLINK